MLQFNKKLRNMDFKTAESHGTKVAFETLTTSKRHLDDLPIDIEPSITPTSSITKKLDHQHPSFFLSILSRFHAGYFRISLSLGWQALLWRTLLDTSENTSHSALYNIPSKPHSIILIMVWSVAFIILAIISLVYILRCFFLFKMVKEEFLHNIGVNYLYAPFVSWLLILQSIPFPPEHKSYLVFWYVFAIPIVILDIKIYGQWFTKGRKKYLTIVANPTSQISIIGNLVCSRAASEMGWKETSLFLFSVGMVHYLVLFVTLYQRLSGSDRLPALLRPVFFLFSAAASMASLAWDSVSGSFDTASKMLFFLSLFLFTSLICRPSLFKKSMKRYNVAWWAYSYPITLLAQASAEYAREVKGEVSRIIMVILSILSVLITLGLLVSTALNSKMLLTDDDPIRCNESGNIQE